MFSKAKDFKNNKEILGKFNIKVDCTPVTQEPRHVAYYPQDLLKKWLDEGIHEEVFEYVSEYSQIGSL